MKRLLLALLLIGMFSVNIYAEPPTGINLAHDVTFQLVTGDLTSTGTQYSTMDTTGTAANIVSYTADWEEHIDLNYKRITQKNLTKKETKP